MSDDEQVEVTFDDNPSDQAVLLLAAAEELGLDPSVVGTSEGAFTVPSDVYNKAFGEEKKPAKKAAAKKSTTRKKD